MLSSAHTPLKSHISGINILCILRFAKNCTRENKGTTFDHKIAKFDTRENFHLYGSQYVSLSFSGEVCKFAKDKYDKRDMNISPLLLLISAVTSLFVSFKKLCIWIFSLVSYLDPFVPFISSIYMTMK